MAYTVTLTTTHAATNNIATYPLHVETYEEAAAAFFDGGANLDPEPGYSYRISVTGPGVSLSIALGA